MFITRGGFTCAVFGKRRRAPKGDIRLGWERQKCMLCACCVRFCKTGALTATETHLEADAARCVLCGRCAGGCPTGALRLETGRRAPCPATADLISASCVAPGGE